MPKKEPKKTDRVIKYFLFQKKKKKYKVLGWLDNMERDERMREYVYQRLYIVIKKRKGRKRGDQKQSRIVAERDVYCYVGGTPGGVLQRRCVNGLPSSVAHKEIRPVARAERVMCVCACVCVCCVCCVCEEGLSIIIICRNAREKRQGGEEGEEEGEQSPGGWGPLQQI